MPTVAATLLNQEHDLIQALACPLCKGKFSRAFPETTLECPTCNKQYALMDGLWDFRTRLFSHDTGWDAEKFDTCYRHIGRFVDGYEHARRSGIPGFVEDYRISYVKDYIGPWISRTGARHLLDVGCGNGWYDFRLKEKWSFGGSITGIDISPFQTALYNTEAQRRNQSNMIAICGNAESLPFTDGHFDVAVSSESLEHVENPLDVIREITRVLKPGGRLFITTPSGRMCRCWKLVAYPARSVKRLISPSRTDPTAQIYDNPLSKKELQRIFEISGLIIRRYTKTIFLPHESYLQFFPKLVLRIMVTIARLGERLKPLTSFLGLHHIIVLEKPIIAE